MQLHGKYDSQKCQLPPREIIVGTPSPILLKGEVGVGPSKNLITWGDKVFLLESGDEPENEDWCKDGGLPLFLLLYSSVQQSH